MIQHRTEQNEQNHCEAQAAAAAAAAVAATVEDHRAFLTAAEEWYTQLLRLFSCFCCWCCSFCCCNFCCCCCFSPSLISQSCLHPLSCTSSLEAGVAAASLSAACIAAMVVSLVVLLLPLILLLLLLLLVPIAAAAGTGAFLGFVFRFECFLPALYISLSSFYRQHPPSTEQKKGLKIIDMVMKLAKQSGEGATEQVCSGLLLRIYTHKAQTKRTIFAK